MRFLKLVQNPVIYSGLIMVLGSNAVNFLNYLYHFVMGRLLGPANYGELATLLSLLNLSGIVMASLGLVIVKFVSSAKNDLEINDIIGWFSRKINLSAFLVLILTILLSYWVTTFLKLSYILIILVAFSYFISLLATFNKAVLQGLLRFKQIVLVMLAENLLKLILGIILVLLGFSVLGAFGTLIFSLIVGLWLSFYFRRDYPGSLDHQSSKSIVKFFVPVFIQSITLTSIYSTDLLLVKHFFSSYETGIYAAASSLARIIFFGSAPIAGVMFPVVSKRHSLGQSHKKVFYMSLLATFIVGLIVIAFYSIYPNLAINLLFGQAYIEATGLLFYFGLFMLLFTLSSLLINYFLSLGKTGVVVLPITASILQITGIFFFHLTLVDVLLVCIGVSALLLLGLLVYLFK